MILDLSFLSVREWIMVGVIVFLTIALAYKMMRRPRKRAITHGNVCPSCLKKTGIFAKQFIVETAEERQARIDRMNGLKPKSWYQIRKKNPQRNPGS